MPLALTELTPPSRGAIAVLELRGPGALQRVRLLCRGRTLEPGRLALVRLHGGGEVLDEALVRIESEELVELHLHGSPAVVRAVAQQLGAPIAPPAGRTLEERAAQALARAPCEAAARTLLDQAEGALRSELERVLQASEAESQARIDALLERARVMEKLLQPARVVLLGPPNAGKSTLFNALLGAERTLVSDRAGTTRDVVVERAHLGAYAVDLVDAPGERGADEVSAARSEQLEREGARIARELAERADLLLWLDPAPGGCVPPASLGGRAQVIRSRFDLDAPAARGAPRAAVAALVDPQGAGEVVARLLRGALCLPEAPWSPRAAAPFEPRQVELLQRARRATPAERLALVAALLSGGDAPAS
jgi:tRNA modification GTPase